LLPEASTLPALARALWLGARETARRMIGVPDYGAYLRHAREHHPEAIPLDYAAFFARAQAARYRGTGGRCC
jgi:uncharacterized short protein YbdD (DUF466 family)